MYTYIPLRFEYKEVKLDSATWSHNTALRKALANSNTAKQSPNRAFSRDHWETGEKKGRPHSRHWGFCRLGPPGQSVLVRLANDGHRWIGGQSRNQSKGFTLSPWLQQSISLRNLPLLSPRHWTGPRWQYNKIIIISKQQQKHLYTSCFFFLFGDSSFLLTV